MYVVLSMNALNFFPHTLAFETVRQVDAVRRHNWSPGYYAGGDDVSVGHFLDEVVASGPDATPQPGGFASA
ncbi:hypothetical protein [Luteibacter sp. Lutesp34]|uniref:hypothetical protein n=1 Tax=Luteibacter sp. Lutesp34 TaxID=3243030 RepID=UPI0039B44491